MTALPTTLKVELFYDGQWNEVTQFVLGQPSSGYGVNTSRGRKNESSQVGPGRVDLTLKDPDFRFSDINPRSPLFGKIGQNTPIRVSIVTPAVSDDVRMLGELADWTPQDAETSAGHRIAIEAAGIMRRLGGNTGIPLSPLREYYRNLDRIFPNFPGLLVSYLPLEEGSTQTGETGNDIQGIGGMDYDTSGDRAPQFGEDDSIPGSASLPDWPVLDYFGWSIGAGILIPADGPYALQVTVRVPEGSGEAWLTEWSGTGGTYSRFALKVDASGFVEISGDDGDGGTFTYTANALNTVDDGVVRHILVAFDSGANQTATVVVDGQTQLFTTVGATPARPDRVRPRPLFTSSTGKDPISLGHVVVLAIDSTTITTFPTELLQISPPVNGYVGEEDSERVRRVALLEGVPAKILYRIIASDEFNRISTSGWNDTDTGQEWVIQQGAESNFTVDGSEAGLETFGTGITQWATTGNLETINGEILVLTGFDGFSPTDTDSVLVGRDDDSDYYSATLRVTNGSDATLIISYWDSLVETQLATVTLSEGQTFTSTDRWWVRFQVVATMVRAKAWMDGEEEPPIWQVEEEDSNLLAGRWGLGANDSADGITTVRFDHFELRDATPTVRLATQQINDPLTIMRRTGESGHGILFESRDESRENPNAAGISYLPLTSLYNPVPDLSISYQACHLRTPLIPTRGDKFRVNDMTARGTEGATARVVKTSGPLSIQKPPDGVGTYADSESTNLQTTSQLQDWAGWAVNLGTQNAARFEVVRFRNQVPQSCPDDPHLSEQIAALETGKIIEISDLPNWHPPEPAELLVQGYQENLDKFQILWGLNSSPANSYHVGFLFGYPADEEIGDTSATQIAPPVNMIRNAILICAWMSVFTPDDYDLSFSGMTAQPEVDGTFSTYAEAYTEVPPGDSGRREAVYGTASITSSAQLSIGVYGNNGPPTLFEHLYNFASAAAITLNTDPNTPVGAWLVAIQAWDWDPSDEMADEPTGTSLAWELVADTQITDNSNPHVKVWMARVQTAGTQMVTFPIGTQTDDHHARLWVLTDAQMILPTAQQRYDSFGSTVASGFNTGSDSTFQVALDNIEDLWTTDPNHFGFQVMVEGARLEVDEVSGTSSPQTFTFRLVNGIVKDIAAGAKVTLYREPIWGV